jgi:hypothetical protein
MMAIVFIQWKKRFELKTKIKATMRFQLKAHHHNGLEYYMQNTYFKIEEEDGCSRSDR